MTISKVARWFGKTSVLLRHVNAISKGRIFERAGNWGIGSLFSRFMRGKWL